MQSYLISIRSQLNEIAVAKSMNLSHMDKNIAKPGYAIDYNRRMFYVFA